MRANVKVNLGPQEFPAGTQQGMFRFRITGPKTETRDDAGVEVVFGPLDPGTYTAACAALDQNGNVLGTAVTVQFTISAAQTVTLSVPTAIAVDLVE